MFLKRCRWAIGAVCCVVLQFPVPAHASLFNDITGYIRQQQQELHMGLSSAIQAVQQGSMEAVLSLLLVSLLYGVFHAAGPGHGKAVISTYILSHNSHLKRSILLSVTAATLQGLTAILLVKSLSGLVFFSKWAVKDALPVMEQASFLFVGLIGAFLMYRALRQFIRLRRHSHQVGNLPPEAPGAGAGHPEQNHVHPGGHHNGHNREHHNHQPPHGMPVKDVCCDHGHAIGPDRVAHISGWRETLGIIFSVGVRPCAGSVIVLTFAELFDLGWAGVLSVVAISAGTALTVCMLALMTVFFRDFAVHFMQGRESGLLRFGPVMVSFAGGLIILSLGISLMVDALTNKHPLL